jgi:hypothetical protein
MKDVHVGLIFYSLFQCPSFVIKDYVNAIVIYKILPVKKWVLTNNYIR